MIEFFKAPFKNMTMRDWMEYIVLISILIGSPVFVAFSYYAIGSVILR